eukprot:GSMAST32.ASY1.ANO1.838.1 assembled CDS
MEKKSRYKKRKQGKRWGCKFVDKKSGISCTKKAQGASTFCCAHGGGNRCQVKGCTTSARGAKSGRCMRHVFFYFFTILGGGRRCEMKNCCKGAQGRTPYCIAHGGGRRCSFLNCDKGATNKVSCAKSLCKRHTRLEEERKKKNGKKEMKFDQIEKKTLKRQLPDDISFSQIQQPFKQTRVNSINCESIQLHDFSNANCFGDWQIFGMNELMKIEKLMNDAQNIAVIT